MTETLATVATETTARRQRRALSGVILNIDRMTLGNGDIVLASLTTVNKGIETVRTLSISGPALETTADLLVEGASVRFYAELGADYVTVIGPDLTKRTLARAAAQAERPAAPVAPKAKRVLSPAQQANAKRFFADIRAKAQANREARLAEQAA